MRTNLCTELEYDRVVVYLVGEWGRGIRVEKAHNSCELNLSIIMRRWTPPLCCVSGLVIIFDRVIRVAALLRCVVPVHCGATGTKGWSAGVAHKSRGSAARKEVPVLTESTPCPGCVTSALLPTFDMHTLRIRLHVHLYRGCYPCSMRLKGARDDLCGFVTLSGWFLFAKLTFLRKLLVLQWNISSFTLALLNNLFIFINKYALFIIKNVVIS